MLPRSGLGGYTHSVRDALTGRVVTYRTSNGVLHSLSSPRRRRNGARLRTQFFAAGADAPGRYGVQFDDVLAHLWTQRHRSRRFRLRDVRYMEELVLVVACTHGIARAWHDLIEQYEWPLTRHCRNWLAEPDAIIFVRRALRDMQAHTSPAATSDRGVSTYLGTRSLRHWLSDRMTSRLRSHHPPARDHRLEPGSLRYIGRRFLVAGGSMGCYHVSNLPGLTPVNADSPAAEGLH
jgi:hypothetical protein